MTADTSKYKNRIGEYLRRRGIDINESKNPPVFRCPNHDDKKPSAILYPERTYCPVCGENWDIFDMAKFYAGATDFKSQLAEVKSVLGDTEPAPEPKKKEKKKQDATPLSLDYARKKYTTDAVNRIADYIYTDKKTGEIREYKRAGSWPYHTADGKVLALDVRFEFPDGKKDILTFWYNGKTLKSAGPPQMIYNLHEIIETPGKPVLIVEGAKCAEIARVLPDFIPSSWNGGTGRVGKIDWSPFSARDVYILHDDDDAGVKAAHGIFQQLPHAKIISPPEKIRTIKKKGGDIEEILQIMTPDELTEYIFNFDSSRGVPDSADFISSRNNDPAIYSDGSGAPPGESKSDFPFKILGVSDDGKGHFLDRHGKHVSFSLHSLNKNILMNLAPKWWWHVTYGQDSRSPWDGAIDDLIEYTGRIDFNPDDIRGRGAWREPDGRICYNDGKTITGEFDETKIYLKLPLKDIGIEDKPITKKTAAAMWDAVKEMSFATPVDAVRCVAWATLAPFAGALPWRPMILMTGESGSGKTQFIKYVINPAALPIFADGSESTPAGIRGKVQSDSCGIVLDEAEADTINKKINREKLLSMMRISSSEDAPDILKGKSDGGYNEYKMKNMFCMVAIDPTVEHVADENRIFRINIAKPDNDWTVIKAGLIKHMTAENCRALRARTWNHLQTILEVAERIADIIQEKTDYDTRTAYADAILISAYIIVWKHEPKPSDKQLNEFFEKFYKMMPAEERRDETAELLDRLLDDRQTLWESRKEMTIREMLIAIKTGWHGGRAGEGDDERLVTSEDKIKLRNHVGRIGVGLVNGELVVQNNSHEIEKIIQKGHGYIKQLWRHPAVIGTNHRASLAGKTRVVTVFSGIFGDKEDDNGPQVEELPL